VFFFVDHQRRIEIMKMFLSLCKSFGRKKKNKAKKLQDRGLRQDERG